MRLTDIVLGVFKKKGITGQPFKFVKRTPGKVDIGKHRIVPPVTCGYKLKLWNRMAIEEENMLYLNNPYLTKDEEKHMPKDIVLRGKNVFSFEMRPRPPLRSVYLAEVLQHLDVNRKWEE